MSAETGLSIVIGLALAFYLPRRFAWNVALLLLLVGFSGLIAARFV